MMFDVVFVFVFRCFSKIILTLKELINFFVIFYNFTKLV
jgi:hypothetical protein